MENLIVAGGVSSIILFAFGFNRKSQANKQRKEGEDFKAQRVFSPEDIKYIISKNDPLSDVLFKKDPQNHQRLIGSNMLVQGQISNESTLLNDLVLRVNYKIPYYRDVENYSILCEKRMQPNYYFKKFENAQNFSNIPQRTITIKKNNVECVVDFAKFAKDSLEHIDTSCFDYQHSEMEKIDSSFWKNLWNIFGLSAAFIGKLFTGRDLKSAFCYEIKVDNCTIGVKNGGLITLIGDIVFEGQTKDGNMSMTMVNLKRVMKSKMQFLREIREAIESLDSSAFWFTFGGIVSFSIASLVFYKKMQTSSELILFRRRFQVPNFIVQAARKLSLRISRLTSSKKLVSFNERKSIETAYLRPREGMECIVCYEKCRSVIIRPCLHCVMCFACYENLPKAECPVCKTGIISEVLIQVENVDNNNNNNPNQPQQN